jgi:Protein of unknown function (DUF2637)
VGLVKLSKVTEPAPVVVLALIAFAGSFGHIHQTAVDHGQTGWMAVAVAICIDLLCVCAARERQRDKRAGRNSGWPTAVLVGGVALSMAANIEQADPSIWGWVVAGTPCGAFATAMLLLERRGAQKPSERPRVAREAKATKEVVVRRRPAQPARRTPQAVTAPVADDLLTRAKELARAYREEEGRPISRDALRQRLGISTNRATVLLRELKATASVTAEAA